MQFKLTVKFPDGSRACDWHDLDGMSEELNQIARSLAAVVPGETITIERTA